MPLEDIEIITAIFAGAVIREGFGKLVRIDLTSTFLTIR
jgi:hypothetical protein